MRYKREKLMKIMNELVNFCLHLNMKDLKIDFSSRGAIGKVSIEGYCEDPPLEKLQDLEHILNLPRQEELEGYYWNLMGDCHGSQHLDMIGVMVDRGSVNYQNNILKISICRDRGD